MHPRADRILCFDQTISPPPLRSCPDSSKHVPDSCDQPRAGQQAGPGRDGSCCHTYRQHCNPGRPGGGGCDPGAMTLVTLDGVGGTAWLPWRFVDPTVFQ